MTIVCATDFSEPAAEAIRVAEAIARKRGEELLLLHAVAIPTVDPIVPYLDAVRADAKERLDKEVAEIGTRGVIARADVALGPAESEVPARIPPDASLLVTGARGHSQGSHWLIGTVAERLARVTKIPMLVVRDAQRILGWLHGQRTLDTIVATDLSAVSDFALRRTQLLRDLGPCDFEILYIEYPPAEYTRLGVAGPICVHRPHPLIDDILERELARRAALVRDSNNVRTRITRTLGATGELIAREAGEADADLVVVGAHQAPQVTHLWRESVAHGVLHSASTNVLVVPFHTADEALRALEVPVASTIVAATDFSPCGNHAVAWACAIASASTHVILTSVVRNESEAEECSRELDRVKAALGNNRRIDTIVSVRKDAAAAICATAERVGADAIVIGRHTRSRVSHVFLGSVSGEVLARSRRPVLIVPDPACV